MRKPMIAMLGFALSLPVLAQRTQIKFEEYDLPNGLHVILHQDKTVPIAAVSVLYHVGSKNEVAGRTGFAHFFEHLLFEGSENIDRGEYMKLVQSNGGVLNANTSQDRTFYYEILPSNQLELGLWMESERMLHAKIDTSGLETQREVVKEEKRQRIDNQPYMSFQKNIFELAYDGTPYEWVPIGSMEDLNAAQLDEFIAFYKQFYVPNNATLSVAGDIDLEQTKQWIEKYFGGIPRGKDVVQPDFSSKVGQEQERLIVHDNIQLPAIIMGFRIPEQNSEDAYALSMLSQLLSGGQSSRLQKRLVDKEQKAMAALVFPFQLEKGGLFITFCLANMGYTTADLESAIWEEIEKLKTEPIPTEEFQKLQNRQENNFVSSVGSVAGIAEQLANYHVYYGDANLINTVIDRYRAITPEKLQEVAKKYLIQENSVVLEYLPKSQQPENTQP